MAVRRPLTVTAGSLSSPSSPEVSSLRGGEKQRVRVRERERERGRGGELRGGGTESQGEQGTSRGGLSFVTVRFVLPDTGGREG